MERSELRGVWSTARAAPRKLAHGLAKYPFVLAAERRMGRLPQLQLVELLESPVHEVRLTMSASRHPWSFGAAEQIVLQMLIADRGVHCAFEIGTFNGGTTAMIAENLPDDGRVVTVDLPDEAFDATQHPDAFGASDVGSVHRASPASHKVEEVRVDSLRLDATPWRAWADLVLVDGAHDYEHGFSDTRSALQIVKPGGIVLWDDFDPYWHGLVNGILDAAGNRPVGRLAGLPLAVLLAD